MYIDQTHQHQQGLPAAGEGRGAVVYNYLTSDDALPYPGAKPRSEAKVGAV